MYFKTLKEKCNYYRSLTDNRLMPNSYVIIMLDGRAFSKRIKNQFNKPFDNKFIELMNQTAKYLAKNIQGCKFAYTQSDEISLIISDFDKPNMDSFFGYRLCKIQSICASMASGIFNKLYIMNIIKDSKNAYEDVNNFKPLEFDCKAWNVPNANDALAWILYRQIDCIRNSKQQVAQAYLTHKSLLNLNTDEQINLLSVSKGINWYKDFNDGEKYGRFIYKECFEYKIPEAIHISKTDNDIYFRNEWTIHDGLNIVANENDKYKIIQIIQN